MKAHIEIAMDNAAFDHWPTELARILRELANKVERQSPDRVRLMDVNGNHVGKFVLVGSKDD